MPAKREEEALIKLKLQGADEVQKQLNTMLETLQQIARAATSMGVGGIQVPGGVAPGVSGIPAGGGSGRADSAAQPPSSGPGMFPGTSSGFTYASMGPGASQWPSPATPPPPGPAQAQSVDAQQANPQGWRPSYQGPPPPAQPPAPTTPATPPPGGGSGGGFEAALSTFLGFGGVETLNNLSRTLAQQSSQAAVGGGNVYPGAMVPSTVTIGAAAAGAFLGGPAGAAAGYMVGNLAEAIIGPQVQSVVGMAQVDDALTMRYGDTSVRNMLRSSSVGLKESAVQAYVQARTAGMPIDSALLEQISDHNAFGIPGLARSGMPTSLQGDYVRDYAQLRYSPSAIGRFGVSARGSSAVPLPDLLDATGSIGNAGVHMGLARSRMTQLVRQSAMGWDPPDAEVAQRVEALLHGDESTGLRWSGGFKWNLSDAESGEFDRLRKQFGDAEERFGLGLKSDASLQGIGLRQSILSSQTARYSGDAQGFASLMSRQRGLGTSTIGTLAMKRLGTTDPLEQLAIDAQIEQVKTQINNSERAEADRFYQTDLATVALESSRAGRTLQDTMLGGARDVDFAPTRAALLNRAGAAKRQMERLRASGNLNDYEEMEFNRQIEETTWEANVGTRLREESRNRNIWQVESAQATLVAQRPFENPKGPVTEQGAAEIESQNVALQKRYELASKILNSGQMLTYEQRAQLAIEQEQAAVGMRRLEVVKVLVGISGRQAEVGAQSIELIAGGNVEMIRGAGGTRAMGISGERAGAMRDQYNQALRGIDDLRAAGYSDSSREMIQQRQLAAGLQVGMEQAAAAMATAPMSAQQGLAMSTAGFKAAMAHLTTGESTTGLTREQIAISRGYIAELKGARAAKEAEGFEWTAADERANQGAIQNEELQNAQRSRQLVIPSTPQSEIRAMSDVQARMQIGQMAYMGEQNQRGALTEMGSLIGNQLTRLIQSRREGMARGEWNEVKETDFTSEKNKLAVQAAGVQQQLENGWLDRIISTAYNMPSNGRLITSQFTRREASMFAGIYNQAFGGSKEQMDYARDGFRRVLGRPGGAEGATEGALAGVKGGGMDGEPPTRGVHTTSDGGGRGRVTSDSGRATTTIHLIVDVKDETGKTLRKVDRHINDQRAGNTFTKVSTQSTQ